MVLKELDEGLHLGCIEVETGAALGDFRIASASTNGAQSESITMARL